VTHNHIEGIKGAQSVASAIFLAKIGNTKNEIKKFIENTFGYELDKTIVEIRKTYQFDVTCQG
jgi:ADP-ribosylglycohydrolase